ncbi:MAG: mevalonate kinase [Thermoprotei archaeon]|nr:MAG: mevalonate kinase [Thermoprotei archaeon]
MNYFMRVINTNSSVVIIMSKRRVIASAPGKVILVGEHFVVRGEPAIAAAITLRARAIVSTRNDNDIIISSEDLGIKNVINKEPISDELRPLAHVVNKLVRLSGYTGGLEVKIKSEIPPASGMGSSAAVSVACVAALNELLDVGLGLNDICKIAYEAEVIVHKKPSGIDNTISTYGGVIMFSKRSGFKRIPFDSSSFKLILADSGIPRNTGVMVSNVLSLYERYPEILQPIYRSAGILANEFARALERGDIVALGELMNINHGLLSAIGVSNKKLEELVYIARTSGAKGAKITGAGGGGFIVAIADVDSYEQVVNSLKSISNRVIVADISKEGVLIED